MNRSDLLHNDMLKRFLRKRKLTAFLVYGIFALIQAALVLWLVKNFRLEIQFCFLLIEIIAFVALYRIVCHLSLAHVFSPLREGIVVSEMTKEATMPKQPTTKWPEKWITVQTVTLGINANGRTYLVDLKQFDQKGLFRAGDRVVFSNALAAPILLSRVPEKYACPICGAIFAIEPKAKTCICGCPVLIPDQEEASC